MLKLGLQMAKDAPYGNKNACKKGETVISESEKTKTLKENGQLTSVLETGKSYTVLNKDLGEVRVDRGKLDPGGYGFMHIIEGRLLEDGMNEETITALLIKINDVIQKGKVTPKKERTPGRERHKVEKDGIAVILSRTKNEKRLVITGYAEKEKEAADAIKAVNAQYGYAPEFVDFQKQVGAAIASISLLSHQQVKESSTEKIKKSFIYWEGRFWIKNSIKKRVKLCRPD